MWKWLRNLVAEKGFSPYVTPEKLKISLKARFGDIKSVMELHVS